MDHYPESLSFQRRGYVGVGGDVRPAGAWVGRADWTCSRELCSLRPRRPLTPSLVLFPCWCPTHSKGWDERIGHSGMAAVAFGITEGKPSGNS